ncbi:UDP-3-O-[3-hydroxymyristoyl] glucosamine N-acyltransferase [Planctomycetes bacterium Pan216]|uniref:UDP-3-O-[3-hydroxymyristoyl] glucosamine N-acyltransferase n=1 Tax=Kolteria novifilia TaxID=2527975 RepID=A0A518B4H3_9BACT|nr:UDP-3-O-[3-hydroxymyristoyl] glucosamine N-acyltransferase [Planctomycetes bacterium Pan216]
MTSTCIVFEDTLVEQLRPINLARSTSSITCGAFCLEELISVWPQTLAYHLRPHLRPIAKRAGKTLTGAIEGPIGYLNAAVVPDLATIDRIAELFAKGEPFLALSDQRITAALAPGAFPEALADKPIGELVAHLLDQRLPIIDDEFATFERTFDVMSHHERLLRGHLDRLMRRGVGKEISKDIVVGEGADIADNVVLDASGGPIVIGKNVRIMPFSYVLGPVRIGDDCRIIDHASIKHGTVLGHTVKAGGELEETIIEPYSNKQHHGFLGHSYIGSWVNLGAGTSNSDLKNTYGEIAISDAANRSVPTGRQFLGCVIGDYTKTAINTSIFTGKLIGLASFLYGFISTNVPSFTNYARSFGQVTEVSVDVAVKTQQRAASRRKVEVTDIDRQFMRDLFEMTQPERQLSSEQLVL